MKKFIIGLYTLNAVMGIASSVIDFTRGNFSGGCGWACSALFAFVIILLENKYYEEA